MSYCCYRHIVHPGRRNLDRLVAIAIVLSFIATLVPIASASVNKSSAMPCCVGKAAGHCDSGIPAAKVPEPEPEPMCGLEQLIEDEYETVVAEASGSPEESTTSDDLHLSLTAPCATDCCALVWSGFKRPRRDFADWIHRGVVEQPLASSPKFQKLPPPVLASTRFNRSIPRGPPAFMTA